MTIRLLLMTWMFYDDLSGNYRPCANVMPLFRSSSIDSVYRDLRNDGIADLGERVCVWNRSMQ